MSKRFVVTPFVGALPITFCMDGMAVESCLGPPGRKGTTRSGIPQWFYHENPRLIVAFSIETGLVDHLGFANASSVTYDDIDLFRDPEVLSKLLNKNEAELHVGFVIFHDLGLAFDDFHTPEGERTAVVVRPRGGWDHMRGKGKPFGLSDLKASPSS